MPTPSRVDRRHRTRSGRSRGLRPLSQHAFGGLKRKTLEEYDFTFPKRIPKAAIVRLFDCDFIDRHGCAVLVGPTGTGKTHLLTGAVAPFQRFTRLFEGEVYHDRV
ncbi:MAG: ATP-binding protein [Bryobacteraceae bacterium]